MFDFAFERRVAAALRADVPTRRDTTVAIMTRVREVAAQSPPRRRAWPRAPRGGSRHSIIGLALAAGIGSITTLSVLTPAARDRDPVAAAVIGDTVVSAVRGSLRDTLRLVRLMFDAPSARQVAVAGDFNAWRADVTPLRRDAESRRWIAIVALRDGEHRYALVVDGERRAPAMLRVAPAPRTSN